MKIFKKIILLFIVFMMLLTAIAPIFGESGEDYSQSETELAKLCRGRGYQENRERCDGYRQYLKDRASSNQVLSDKLKQDRIQIQEDIQANFLKIQEYTQMIKDFETEIIGIEAQIVEKEAAIQDLLVKIQERKDEIKKIEDEVSEYMISNQSTMRVNGYVEFVMGSSSFPDIIRRVEGLNNIKRYHEELIETLRQERIALETDLEAVEIEKEGIETDKVIIEGKKTDIETVKAEVQVFYDELVKQKIDLDMQDAALQEKISLDNEAAARVNSMVSAGGAFMPVENPHVTERVGPYAYNTFHAGIDFGGYTGEPVYALGNGVVLATTSGCTVGSTGCGYGYGNYIQMIFITDNGVYGSLYGHLRTGGVAVTPGQTVSAGQVIGYMGNTGLSFGSHLHVEIFDLGYQEMGSALQAFNGSSIQFGLGGSRGRYSSFCDVKGSTPCRLYPDKFLGV